MNKFKKFYVYEGSKPIGIIDRADEMPIDEIIKVSRLLDEIYGRTIHLKPLKINDFPCESNFKQ